jgi:methanogenic corrinoid protein MtbC1
MDSSTPFEIVGASGDARHGAAVRSLAEEVIARLAARDGGTVTEAAPDPSIDEICEALIAGDGDAALGFAEAALAEGLGFGVLCETRLAPAARRLGELWEQDQLSFAEVTLAASRLFFILRTVSPGRRDAGGTRTAVFAAAPDEEHLLGVTMAAERARAIGWSVDLAIGQPHDRIVDRISHHRPDVVGLAVSGDRSILPVARLVVALRVAVPGTPIIVCGGRTDIIDKARNIVGADAVATGFDDALAKMERLAEAARGG